MKPIPNFFHMVWIGGPPTPDKLENFARLRSFHWGSLHKDEEYAGSKTAKLLAGRDLPWAVQADFWRIELLLELGGVYLDADSLVLRDLTPFIGERRPWVATSVTAGDRSGFVSNAFMGFPSGHPFLQALWERAVANLAAGKTDAFALAGPTQVRKTLGLFPGVEVVREVFRNSTLRSSVQARREPLKLLARNPLLRVLHLSDKSWVEPLPTRTLPAKPMQTVPTGGFL